MVREGRSTLASVSEEMENLCQRDSGKKGGEYEFGPIEGESDSPDFDPGA